MRALQSTRQEILEILKKNGRASVDELAQRLGLTAMCIRQHLSVLERDGLVSSREERQKLGRPRYIYTLTERAEELFPRSYHVLLDWILDEIETMDGQGKVAALLERLADRLAGQFAGALEGKDIEARVAKMAELLTETGSLAEWQKADDGYLLNEHNCRYHAVALRHRQICNLELLFLKKVFGADVKLVECLLDDGPRCKYLIRESMA